MDTEAGVGHKSLVEIQGLPSHQARQEISRVLGHNWVDMVGSYALVK